MGLDLHDLTRLRIRESEISESQVITLGPVSHLRRHGRIQPCRPVCLYGRMLFASSLISELDILLHHAGMTFPPNLQPQQLSLSCTVVRWTARRTTQGRGLPGASLRPQQSLSDKKRTASRETDVTWRRAPGTSVIVCTAPRAWVRGSPWPTSKRELGPARCETVQQEGRLRQRKSEEGGRLIRLLRQPFPRRLFLPRAHKSTRRHRGSAVRTIPPRQNPIPTAPATGS